jgi:RNA polymerase sigma-70 factor (ECF subfamily)
MDEKMDSAEKLRTLLRQISEGDEKAAEEFFDMTFDSLYRFIYYHLKKDRVFVEDLVQEIFLLISKKPHEVAIRKLPFAWMCQVARNKVIDHRRQENVHNKWQREVGHAVWKRENRNLSGEFSKSGDLIHQCLAILDPLHQKILIKKYFKDMSVRDMAKICGKTEKGVESLLYRARQAFRFEYQNLMAEMKHE